MIEPEKALERMSLALDDLVHECLDPFGSPKTPTRQALMRAMGRLPPYCRHALTSRSMSARIEAQTTDETTKPYSADDVQRIFSQPLNPVWHSPPEPESEPEPFSGGGGTFSGAGRIAK